MDEFNFREASGQRVRRLRLSLGLSQADLAARTGSAPSQISLIENGRASTAGTTVGALSRVLDCDVNYLLEARPELLATQPRLRAYADAPQKAVEQAVADAMTAIEAATDMRLRFVRNLLPLFDGDPKDDLSIERWALEVRSVAGLAEDAVIGNVTRTVERLGCVVLPMDSELGRHLGISFRVGEVPVIRASRTAVQPERAIPGDRQRFTVAHEVGHLILHHDDTQPTSPAQAGQLEKQANRFASAFLVPGDALMDDIGQLGGRVTLSNLSRLKEKWGFAIKAFVVRFHQLGVIDDEHARSLYKQISARRWNRNEPVPVGNESGVWLHKAIATASKGIPVAKYVEEHARIGYAYAERWTNWSAVDWGSKDGSLSRPSFGQRSSGQASNSAPILRLPARPAL